MSTNAAELRGKKKRRDPRDRSPEFVQFDVTDGAFANFFHRFFARRMSSQDNPKPYPWFIGGVHRLARMLDVGFAWELVALAAYPVFLALGVFERTLGFPPHLAGYIIVFLTCYTGYFFVLLVFLDRRLDLLDKMRKNMMSVAKVDKRNARLLRRREAARNAPEIKRRTAEALARGQKKAVDHEYDELEDPPEAAVSAPPPMAAQPALDDLLK